MGRREERMAENELYFKQLNERINGLERTWGYDVLDAVCECADQACFARVPLQITEYVAIRENPRLFIVAPGHELPDAESVVERHDSYCVVEKPADAVAAAEPG